MRDVRWSTHGERDCIRVTDTAAGARLAVWPSSALARPGAPPSMAGEIVADGADLCFVPRFGFVEGTVYAVVADGLPLTELARPRAPRPATTEVLGIVPATACVPRNLLRLYVWFSASMSEGQAASQLRLEGDDGRELDHALLVVDDELWDADRQRLTVLLDPARIKRGLVAHRALGYPLEVGSAFRVVVDGSFLDATGAPLRRGASRRFEVGPDERRRVDPAAWTLAVPSAGSRDEVEVTFDRPLDVGLVPRCLAVHERGHAVDGRAVVTPDGGSWSFTPDGCWSAQSYEVVVDERLEDLAGNSVRRVFDHELADDHGSGPPGHATVELPFAPRPS